MAQLAALLLGICSLLVPAGDNPEFGYWAEHKPGSWVKLKMELEANGATIVVEATHTLTSVDAEKVAIERKNKVTVNGMAQPDSTEKDEVFKDKEKEKNPLTIEKEGDEEIDVAGKKMKTHWVEGTQKDKSKVKFWLVKDVPGGIVKGEATGGELPGKLTMSALSWEKK
jgi:hypothetical protein